jgi:nucleoside-diphosphate-sugar epimerase
MAQYLVTGGAGFIGSHITEELLRRGENVRVLDNFSTGKRRNLDSLRDGKGPHADVKEGDICDLATVRSAMRGVDFVLHQAALPSVARSVSDPVATNTVNVDGTLNVLVAARDEKVRRVVYASSSSVYGNTPTLPKIETMPTHPVSPYAVSKLAAESYCVAFHEVFGLETVCLRYFNVFGPRQDPDSQYSAVIPKFIVANLRGQAPVIHGDGLQSRDFTFVGNVVLANLLACLSTNAIGKVMNIACGDTHTLLDLHRDIEKLTGKNVRPVFVQRRKGDIKDSMSSIELAARCLGYAPVTGWLAGLQETIEWYQRHQAPGADKRPL